MLIEPRRWSCLVPARARMHGARRYARRSTHIYVRAATGHLHYSGGVLSLPSSNQHAFPSLLAYSAHAACASRVIRTTVRVALRTVWAAAARAPTSLTSLFPSTQRLCCVSVSYVRFWSVWSVARHRLVCRACCARREGVVCVHVRVLQIAVCTPTKESMEKQRVWGA